MERSPTGAVDQSQVRQPPRQLMKPWLLSLVLLLPSAGTGAADETTAVTADGSSSVISRAAVEARMKEVEASAELDEAARSSLSDLLTKTLGYLEAIRSNKAAGEAYQQALQTAPQEAAAIREQLGKDAASNTEVTVQATDASPYEEIEQELLQEKANLAAVRAKQTDLEDQIASLQDRPAAIRQRLVEVKTRKDDLESALKEPVPEGELPWLSEARRWAKQAEIAALRSETGMLDQELLSQPVRIKLLEAKRDRETRSFSRISTRVNLLEELASRKGRAEVEKAEATVKAAVDNAEEKHPLIRRLAKENAELTQSFKTTAEKLRRISSRDDEINAEAKGIEERFRGAREKLKIAGLSQVLGKVMRQQRATLPDLRDLARQPVQQEQENAQVALRQIQHAEERRHLRDIDEYVTALLAEVPAGEAAGLRDDLKQLAETRDTLLEKAITIENSYMRALDELEVAYRRLYDVSRSYDEFLAKNLLWVRTAPWPGLDDLHRLPGQVAALLSPANWVEVSGILIKRAAYSPPFLPSLVLLAYIIWKKRRFRALLRVMGQQVGKPSVDRFSFTLKALGLTLLLAAPLPLILYAAGWELGFSPQATKFSQAVSTALLWVAPALFYVQFYSVLCAPGGVANRHFLWPEQVTARLRREFNYLKVTFLPLAFLTVLIIYRNPGTLGVGLERLTMMTTLVLLAIFFYRVSGVALKQLSHSAPRVRQLYMVLTVLLPLLLAGLVFVGYFYTAGMLAGSLVATLWFVFGLAVLHQLAVRWLLLAQRRIYLKSVRERMQAARKATGHNATEIEGITVDIEEPEPDLLALRDASRKLLNTFLVIIGIVGFWLLWRDLLPAFGILDTITLWHHTVVDAGEEKLAPITLADIGQAILIAVATLVAVKRLPAVLEIVLLQRFNMTSGSRYTVTALTTYAIIAVGAVLFFRVIGADWSKLQWLFAALGVGIGFGLQEIVANFISGLIILFERPIRVGDVVTVGDTDGVVTRIRIRATTIRNWENQELLVPNKEFIAGRLLNWSLSDQTTRVKVPVGVAYGSDVQKAMQLMDQAARENASVLADPAPSVIFEAFGDNTLNLVLRCFVGAQQARMPTISELHEAINRKFSEAGISIAFPQRDVHLDTAKPLDIRIRRDNGKDQTGDQ